ncbi:MAG: hypothetical protein F6K31_31350, partial [Symploca sp. SIO2G7]|nr:hypothetical protein [Symploca sp. SIO2G7]
IKSIFAKDKGGYVLHKGKKFARYNHKDQGYQLQILCLNEAEAKQFIRDVLRIQDDTPDWGYLSMSSVVDESSRFPVNPGTETFLGKSRSKPNYRPVAKVRFRYAALKAPNAETITFVDLTGRRRSPIISVF